MIIDDVQLAGTHQVTWNPTGLSSVDAESVGEAKARYAFIQRIASGITSPLAADSVRAVLSFV